MTLYLLFEKLEKGAMTLQTRSRSPSTPPRRSLPSSASRPGETIWVEDAIKAIVTRSANDMAVAVAEAIGHDEDDFADMMTHKAHELGMSRTLYRNASGLPNDEQMTTAHDLAVLGALAPGAFPQIFPLFLDCTNSTTTAR